MPKAVDIEAARVERLAREMVPTFKARGSLIKRIDAVDDVERWRKAARRAGKLIGWRVRTGISNDGSSLWAVSDDYEPTPEDERRATDAIAALLQRRRSDDS
jgi:hypothetical protein